MQNLIELMITKRLHQSVDMIRHENVFAEHVPFLVEEF
jgi:hypothetical protein